MILRCLILSLLFISFHPKQKKESFVVVLGTAQDAGYPQIDCKKDCCKKYWEKKMTRRKVSCLALFDPESGQKWIFDATPDFTEQLHEAEKIQTGKLSGIFLTHAHIGHYSGLMYLGREGMSAIELPVYAMPQMNKFLQNNGPWNQLVALKNIKLLQLQADSAIQLTSKISVTPVIVPHRDEYSETVGYSIKTENRSLLFIPDIDKWQKWNRDIKEMVKQYDYLFLDGTFYADGELPGRNMNEVPHPFVQESLTLFNELTVSEKKKIWFIHFNHTNPLLNKSSFEFSKVKAGGFNVAEENLRIGL